MSDDERLPAGWLIHIAWMSSLYSAGSGPEWQAWYAAHPDGEDEPEEVERTAEGWPIDPATGPEDPSWRGGKDVQSDPAWQAWLTEHMSREDLFLMLRVDDVPRARVTSGRSRNGDRSFTRWIPVEEFLADGASERRVIRVAICELYGCVADKLGVPAPPAVLLDDPGPG